MALCGPSYPPVVGESQIAAVAALPPHPHLVGQYRAWQQGGHFYIQMELCQGGSLAHLLSAVRMRRQKERLAARRVMRANQPAPSTPPTSLICSAVAAHSVVLAALCIWLVLRPSLM